MANRTVEIDKDNKVKYDYTEKGSGFQVTPNVGNPFWISDLDKADDIVRRVFTVRRKLKR